MQKLIFAVSALSLSIVAGTVLAQQGAPSSRPGPAMSRPDVCLQFNRLKRWSVVNANTLEITDETEKKYRVTLNGNCAHSSFADRVIFERSGQSGLDCVEPGDRVDIKQANAPSELCLVSSVSYYTDAQKKLDAQTNPAKP